NPVFVFSITTKYFIVPAPPAGECFAACRGLSPCWEVRRRLRGRACLDVSTGDDFRADEPRAIRRSAIVREDPSLSSSAPIPGAGLISAYHGRSVAGFSPGPGSGGQSPPRASASSSASTDA